jgi:hypothetical protein
VVAGWVKRHLALLGLPGAHVQRAVFEIDVCAVAPDRFPESEAGRGHQADHGPQCRRAQRRCHYPAACISAVTSSGD